MHSLNRLPRQPSEPGASSRTAWAASSGGSWWIAYCHRGRVIRESVARALRVVPGSVRESDAWTLVKRRTGELQGGKFVGPSQERVTFGELLDAVDVDYRNNGRPSLDTLRVHMKPVRAAFGLDRAVDVTEARVERYKADRLADEKAPATINRELAIIRRAFTLAVRQKRLSMAPTVMLLAEHNARQGFFERGEFEAVCAELPTYSQDFARFAYLSAWRKAEVASLTWAKCRSGGPRGAPEP
jgi:integrase